MIIISKILKNRLLVTVKLDPLKIITYIQIILYINLEDLLSKVTIEDRVYRLRCVEAWSMVIPWQGFPLSKLIEIGNNRKHKKFQSLSKYKLFGINVKKNLKSKKVFYVKNDL